MRYPHSIGAARFVEIVLLQDDGSFVFHLSFPRLRRMRAAAAASGFMRAAAATSFQSKIGAQAKFIRDLYHRSERMGNGPWGG